MVAEQLSFTGGDAGGKVPFSCYLGLMSDGQRVLPRCRGRGEQWLGGLMGNVQSKCPLV